MMDDLHPRDVSDSAWAGNTAKPNGYDASTSEEGLVGPNAANEQSKPNGYGQRSALPSIERADVGRWQGREPPELVFTVADLVPQGMVTLLTSQGGAGKTLLLQMLGTTVAAGGITFLGKATVTGRAAGVFAEDPENVLHIRQPRINQHLDIDYDRIAGRYFPQ